MIGHSKGFILSTQPNFRDMGGIRTGDGRSLRDGLVFRSGDLSMLSDADLVLLENIGIRSVVDFRSAREIAKRPDREPATVLHRIRLPIVDAAREKAMQLFDDRNAEGLKELLVDDYRRMVSEHADAFKGFFKTLTVPGHLPLVFHCAAGKDRTGLAAWFLLSALGVPVETIREDYLATNVFSKSFADKIVAKIEGQGMHGEIMRPLLEVREEYINAALRFIDLEFGGMERYLKSVLHADFDRLQDLFLTAEDSKG